MQAFSVTRPVSVRPRAETLAYAGLTVSTLAWASAFVIGKVVLAEMTPLTVAVWRYSVAVLILLPLAIRQRPAMQTMRRVAGPLAIMIVCGGVLYPWLFLFALSRTSATNTALLIALNPVLTLLFSPLVGERLHRRHFGGVALALFGAITVINRGQWHDVAHVAALSLNTGDLLAVAAAANWAAFNLGARRVMSHLTAAVTNCLVYGGGALVLSLFAWPEGPLTQLTRASHTAVAGLLGSVKK